MPEDRVRKRIDIVLDDATALELHNVGQKSEYVRNVVTHRARVWVESLAYLRGRGWSNAEITCAVDILNGHLTTIGMPLSHDLAISLEDGAEIDGSAARWGVGDTWRERIATVRDDECAARALWEVVTEFWLGNERVRKEVSP